MPIANDDLYAQSWNMNFGSNPFDDGPSQYSQNTEDTEYIPIQTPEENRPPFDFQKIDFQKIVGVGQWNRPLNQMKILQMKSHHKSVKMIMLI